MIISVQNHAEREISNEALLAALRAINRQLAEDYAPYWGRTAQLRLVGRGQGKPSRNAPVEMRGDAIVYLWDQENMSAALGFHDENHRGVPYGFVFTRICEKLKEPWTVTLSHEVLEMVGDAEGNLVVSGPHPDPKVTRQVFHWYEMCDAVQGERYAIDGIAVSNFVLPAYFTRRKGARIRRDFLGRSYGGKMLRPFGVNPGGYVGFFDPEKRDDDAYFADKDAQLRADIKNKIPSSRGARRRQTIGRAG